MVVCAHYWVLHESIGTFSNSTCKLCGSVRLFKVTWPNHYRVKGEIESRLTEERKRGMRTRKDVGNLPRRVNRELEHKETR